eukprot:TRINITY_DN10919_c0_g1_i1.p1 TRINITY_DN10919_c0_g1~~TRINITY_DN10919_c0_g1_i1.p1  ORF type:complete len:323 (+),score=53.17 TRINITY_DN10919_c0_g1_i1:135-1103(+)
MKRCEFHRVIGSSCCLVVADSKSAAGQNENSAQISGEGTIQLTLSACPSTTEKVTSIESEQYQLVDPCTAKGCLAARKGDMNIVIVGVMGDGDDDDDDDFCALTKACDVIICTTQLQLNKCRKYTPGSPWYTCHMLPRDDSKDKSQYAWLDPSGAYSYSGGSFKALVSDLVSGMRSSSADNLSEAMVVGIDAMGFILGSAIAYELGLPFIPFRKAGKLCVLTDSVKYVDYSRTEKSLESRTKSPSLSGKNLLIIDQWIETGGTSLAGIELGKKLGGIPILVVAVAAETAGRDRISIPVVTAVHSASQPEIDAHALTTFALHQ